MERTCPTCQAILPDGVTSCPHCQAPAPPPIATPVAPPPSFATPVPPRPQMPAGVVIKPKVNYRDLARWQRCLLWLVLVQIVANFLFMFAGMASPVAGAVVMLVWLGLSVAVLVVIALVMVAEGSSVVVVVLASILMFAPCVNLLILLLVNRSATRNLRRAGIRVGFMGARDDDVERITNPALCTFCGYNLTGNVSGYCPECGNAMM